jgi:hypothetical protein
VDAHGVSPSGINNRNWRSTFVLPDGEINWTNFWKMTLQRLRRKSPLAI